eukprot:CAMPEP_0197865930 /NCGR_PEP_ID=MMETSP1438-20131217/43942_1 /TAXON_ID=1461541 /ORGANISM="Pterosperma sp., Strain CCMP1384" /LENGTH=347 /DNA_ID=CAMNT_0043484453 /DNA_START=246 /DNA_END=1286 /DNA_ORIENTATION=-
MMYRVLVLGLMILGTLDGAMCTSVEIQDDVLTDTPELYLDDKPAGISESDPTPARGRARYVVPESHYSVQAAGMEHDQDHGSEPTTDDGTSTGVPPPLPHASGGFLVRVAKDLLLIFGAIWAWEPWNIFKRRGKDGDIRTEQPVAHRTRNATDNRKQVHQGPGKEEDPKKAAAREYWMDHLKVFMSCQVIYLHNLSFYGGQLADATGAAVGYHPSNPLYTMFAYTQESLDAYFMDVFFFLSAYQLHDSVEKKGTKLFLKDRFRQLGTCVVAENFSNICRRFLSLYLLGVFPLENINPVLHMLPVFSEGVMWFNARLLLLNMAYIALGQPLRNLTIALPQFWILAVLW